MGTSAFFLVRFTGSILGLALAGAIFSGKSGDALEQLDTIRSSLGTQGRSELIRAVSSALQACTCLYLHHPSLNIRAR
jgi:hypothetical protein